MISLERLREIGGKFALMSDAELTEARAELYSFGNLSLRAWNEEKVPNFPTRLIAKNDENGIIHKHD